MHWCAFKNARQILIQASDHSRPCLSTTNCRHRVLIRTTSSGWSSTHTHTHALLGLPNQFLPVRVSSLPPESGPHTEPTCFAMQCFYTGTKCQLAKSICAPLFPLSQREGARGGSREGALGGNEGEDGEKWQKKSNVVMLKGQRQRGRRGRWHSR